MDKEAYIALYNDPNTYDQWDIGKDHVRSQFLLTNIIGPKVIELGCGGSGFLRLLVERGFKCSAVDINPKWINLGRERLPDVIYTHSMVEDFETEEKYNAVILMEILEHVIDPVVILSKARSLLAPGGRVLITVPRVGGPWDFVDSHVRQYDLPMLSTDIVQAHFEDPIVYVVGDYIYGVLM